MSAGNTQAERPQVDSSINKINWRIHWCRLQQQRSTVSRDEREGWWAEEAGLTDALIGRDRTAFMKARHQCHVRRYLCGLHDGQALLCLQASESAM